MSLSRQTAVYSFRQYLPHHRWSSSSLPSLGSCLYGSPSVRPSSSPWPRRRRSSSSRMPRALRSFGRAPSGTFCHAPAGICEKPLKFKSSSCVDWLNAWSRSAAPSAPWVPVPKHLQCFVKNNLSKAPRDYDKCRYTIHLKPIYTGQLGLIRQLHKSIQIWTRTTFQQRQINTRRKQENPSTISLCEAPIIETCLLQIEPLSTTNFLPRPCWDPRTAVKIQLFQQGRLTQRLKQICGSICSSGDYTKAPAVCCQKQSVDSTLGLRQVQVHNPS